MTMNYKFVDWEYNFIQNKKRNKNNAIYPEKLGKVTYYIFILIKIILILKKLRYEYVVVNQHA